VVNDDSNRKNPEYYFNNKNDDGPVTITTNVFNLEKNAKAPFSVGEINKINAAAKGKSEETIIVQNRHPLSMSFKNKSNNFVVVWEFCVISTNNSTKDTKKDCGFYMQKYNISVNSKTKAVSVKP